MSTTRTSTPENIYNNQIAPQLDKLMRRCKHYDIPVLFAVAMPFGSGNGVIMSQLQLDKEDRAPATMIEAWQALQPKAESAAPALDAHASSTVTATAQTDPAELEAAG